MGAVLCSCRPRHAQCLPSPLRGASFQLPFACGSQSTGAGGSPLDAVSPAWMTACHLQSFISRL